jgi:hypothetical protein
VRYRSLTPESDAGTADLQAPVAKIGASGGTLGFYGLAAPITKPSVTRQTTKTTTALRADIDRVSTALVNLGLITVT